MQPINLSALHALQNFFLETVCLNPSIDINVQLQNPLSNEFNEKIKHRLQAYRTSYYSRVSGVLCECLFYPAWHLLGKNLISNLLIDFFSKYNSKNDMVSSVKNLPTFLQSHAITQEFPFISDLMQLCIYMYEILSAPDPNENLFNIGTNLSNIFLQKEHIFMKSNWPIFQLYQATLQQERTRIINQPECILIFKSSSCHMQVIFIPKNYEPIIDALSQGESLENALESSTENENDFDENNFISWISNLTSKNAFILY